MSASVPYPVGREDVAHGVVAVVRREHRVPIGDASGVRRLGGQGGLVGVGTNHPRARRRTVAEHLEQWLAAVQARLGPAGVRLARVAAKPDLSLHATDPAFDPYRSRVAELYRDDRQVGLAYVRMEAWSEAVGGRWWWTRWSEPVEVPHIFFLVDGDHSDTVGGPEGNDEWLAEWDQGCFDYYGETLQARWLSIEESERQERSAFALDGTAKRG